MHARATHHRSPNSAPLSHSPTCLHACLAPLHNTEPPPAPPSRARHAQVQQHPSGGKSSKQLTVQQLEQLVADARAESHIWEAQLAAHDTSQERLRAQLDALAAHQAGSREALRTLQELLGAAKLASHEQRMALFAESVFLCGREQRPASGGSSGGSDASQSSGSSLSSSDAEGAQPVPPGAEPHFAFTRARAEAAQQLLDYEARLTRMVDAVSAGVVAAHGTQLRLPALVGGDEPASSNNIVPLPAAKKLVGAAAQRQAAGDAEGALTGAPPGAP